ncbi:MULTISPECIES: potassium/proton antiporter [Pseudoalteromonas]|uniref:Potassium/proton antiporter n=1 Tax=Pseudoalteromonas haloplanktis TaxID=228 RepID=A0ABU1BA51_PSEHA|nr:MULTISPECIES: potassium/proton antiporter [Pseudoalteromonas]MCF6143683.1 cell volume regulation protein A [Pseudoalteromonas mariniglutinosa NCIMB 1770]MDQ9091142.1 potassium/proton antiporter [Pseudoalteromonas haloplanktis]TMN71424.1 potassium/proton antiporter [Pseudoalteromonas sp. S1727]BDF93549.1 K+/H+ antiporter [Pseudoalteromonas sp. KAN5]
MFVIDNIILVSAILILFGVISSKLSARVGLPVLVLFLLVGMLAGEDGIAGISFDNAEAAHALGTLALAIILFDGGLQTPISSIKQVWKPASALATVGVLLTAVITGAVATYILDLPVLQGILLGAIVGSTDAAAVFALLRSAGIHLNKKLKSTLEIESASNDPMAIFLTVGLLEVLVNKMTFGGDLLLLFVQQMGVGALCGVLIGKLATWFINRIKLNTSGLYLVMVTAFGLLSFGLSASLGGSGFLAVFITGVILGNSEFVYKRSIFLFHDGLAWLGQITMFVVLGLLINPSSLLDVWLEGLFIAFALIFIARPLAVAPILKLFGFNNRETMFVSWVGLRGSVPIILAIFPLLFGLPGAELIFNVVFFVVLISATLQGASMPWIAKKLGLVEPPPVVAAAKLEITALNEIDIEIVEYTLSDASRVVGRRLSRAALPESVVVAMITRGSSTIPPRGSTVLKSQDHLFVVLKPYNRPFVDLVFAATDATHQQENHLAKNELRVKGVTLVGDIFYSYNMKIEAPEKLSLEELINQKLTPPLCKGAIVVINNVQLRVITMVNTRIVTIGLKYINPKEQELIVNP